MQPKNEKVKTNKKKLNEVNNLKEQGFFRENEKNRKEREVFQNLVLLGGSISQEVQLRK